MSDPEKVVQISEPGQRALPNPASTPAAGDASFKLQRAFNALRMAAPFVQRVLPLLDGNIATAVSNIFSPHPSKPAPRVDLAPVETGLAELHSRQHELRAQVMDQNTSLKRVEDRLDALRQASDRNALEQKELMAGLNKLGNKVNRFALVAFALLTISILLNIFLYLRIQHLLP